MRLTKNNPNSILLNEKNISSEIKVEKDLKDKIKIASTSNRIAQSLEKALNHKSSENVSGSSSSLLENQERNNNKIMHRELKKNHKACYIQIMKTKHLKK
ncbi:hypothetical protein [Borreliella garinii]|uniref:hypothetical protein n=1 Tax=Borreliella garinii TaxID=29519 RepID=UPI00018ACF3F|nr:hypothetical protein [Borreliella garinii]ACL35244.1 hypothetical protein BGAFAR04_Ab0001 [Borreliella garinii Far04]WNZ67130.1 hypothetical protein PT139_04680 [Borreliella garinii]WNZ68130.1 hypothetical protein PT135_04690 [Borreliella garinii]WNZ69128.1 hypothetical protein PT138_04695 [Borreliella garinii]WNZ70129.1 hypothetical protein PT140_04680 [Borreliella garinii]